MSDLERKLVRAALALSLVGVAAAAGCSNDYDQFHSPEPVAAGGRAGSGARPSTGGTGNVGVGGSTGGVGGGVGSGGSVGSAGSAGQSGSAGTAGSGGCSVAEKLCGTMCVPRNDPNFGCAAPSCNPCNVPNATVICTNGQCSSTGCRPGFQDCNNNLQDGCEQPSGSSVTNCGACGRACSSANVATLECTNNACTSSCQPGFANCRRPTTGADDGCEQNITTNNQNCGSCGNACSDQGTSGGLVCAGSHCGCTGDAQCRVGTGSGTATCNVAARRCACDGAVQCNEGETCQRSGNGRACRCNNTGAACAAGQVCCDTPAGCRNLLTDPTSCGACGLACPAGFTCSSGQCVGGPPDAGQVDSGQPDTGTLVDAGVDSGDDAAPDVSPIDSSTD